MGVNVFRWIALAMFGILASICSAGTLTITSPTNNSFISPSSQITFNVSGAVVQVTVTVTTTFPNGSSTTSTQQVLPGTDGTASGSVAVNLSSSSPEGEYMFKVSATEPNNTYAPTTISVTLLPQAPQFSSFSPPDGTFENGTVHIRGSISDDHLQLWTVQVNGQNIPNNTGTTTQVAVDWDTSGVVKDGVETITIVATDQANQTTTTTANITLCRVPPIITIENPGTGTVIVPGSTINVAIAIQGEFANSINKTGVDVRVMTTNGVYITRVPFSALTTSAGSPTTSIWTGRILYQPGRIPKKFRLMITSVDKAGNAAAPQTQIVTIGS